MHWKQRFEFVYLNVLSGVDESPGPHCGRGPSCPLLPPQPARPFVPHFLGRIRILVAADLLASLNLSSWLRPVYELAPMSLGGISYISVLDWQIAVARGLQIMVLRIVFVTSNEMKCCSLLFQYFEKNALIVWTVLRVKRSISHKP